MYILFLLQTNWSRRNILFRMYFQNCHVFKVVESFQDYLSHSYMFSLRFYNTRGTVKRKRKIATTKIAQVNVSKLIEASIFTEIKMFTANCQRIYGIGFSLFISFPHPWSIAYNTLGTNYKLLTRNREVAITWTTRKTFIKYIAIQVDIWIFFHSGSNRRRP